jgi:hypothetical protein
MIVNNEFEGIWKEVVVTYFKRIAKHFWRDCGKPRQISAKIMGVPVGIGTGHPLHATQEFDSRPRWIGCVGSSLRLRLILLT